jgi:hypothetical protein
MESVESMERSKLSENKADKGNQPEINTFLKTSICDL